MQLTLENTPQLTVNAPVQLTPAESLFLMRLIECAEQYAVFDSQQFCTQANLDTQSFAELCRHLEDLHVIERTAAGMPCIAAAQRQYLATAYHAATKKRRTSTGMPHAGGRPRSVRVSFTLKELPESELKAARVYAREVLRGRSRGGVYLAPASIVDQHRNDAEFSKYITVQAEQHD